MMVPSLRRVIADFAGGRHSGISTTPYRCE